MPCKGLFPTSISIPDISFVVRYLMATQECTKLFLKGSLAVLVFLRFDVFNHFCHVGSRFLVLKIRWTRICAKDCGMKDLDFPLGCPFRAKPLALVPRAMPWAGLFTALQA